MKVIFMGTPDFSVGTLEELIKAGHEVVAVVTQPDKPKGRGGAMSMSPVKEAALRHSITVLQPERAKDAEFVEQLRTYNADVFVVVAFGQILSEDILTMPRYGCINVHASLLPHYRGASPIQWAVIDGCEYSGVTTMKMDKGIDTGDILLFEKIKLDRKETGGSLFERLSSIGAKLLVSTLEKLEKGEITPVKQNEQDATYVKMIKKSFGKIDFNNSAISIERKIRGLNPWPSAYTLMGEKMLKIWDADVVDMDELTLDEKNMYEEASNGTVIGVRKHTFIVKCGKQSLMLKELQLEGKKRMNSDSFLRGNEVTVGMRL